MQRPPIPEAEPIIRVRVHRTGAGDAVRVGCRGGWIRLAPAEVGDIGAGRAVEGVAAPAFAPIRVSSGRPGPGLVWTPAVSDGRSVIVRAPVSISLAEHGWVVVDAWDGRVILGGAEPVEFSAPAGGGPTMQLGGRSYAGRLRCVAAGGVAGSMDIINDIALEAYLPGVLAGELYAHWHLHTHAAQAVAARSFACCEHALNGKRRHYDVTDTQASQVYTGAGAHEKAVRAVRMTRGVVLAWEDALVPGYYSSCCGGTAARAVDAIGPHPVNDVPPLHGRSGSDVCMNSPRYRWQIDRRVDRLTRRLVVYGEAVGNPELTELGLIAAIEAAAHNEHGRPTRYRLTDRRGRAAELPAERFRIAANFSGQGLRPPGTPLHSSHVAAGVIGPKAAFEGQGFGHGAGLCQYGAEALAQQGETFESILNWYYPGAEFAQGYE